MAAFAPVGAASLAASYVNLQNPGTYDAAAGVAPTWAADTGWTFNGTTQYLTTGGLVPANNQTWSVLVRFSNGPTAQNQCLFGSAQTGEVAPYFLLFSYWGGGLAGLYGNGSFQLGLPGLTSGVIGFAGNKCYQNGVAQAGTIPSNAGTIVTPYIGARNDGNSAVRYHISAKVQALAIYSATLSGTEVATLTTLMNALPVASAKGLPIIAYHHRQVFGG